MDILDKLKKLKGAAKSNGGYKSWVMVAGGILCLIIGISAKHMTGTNDSPPEQVAEYIIEEVFNIDIDFSDDDVPAEIKEPKKVTHVD